MCIVQRGGGKAEQNFFFLVCGLMVIRVVEFLAGGTKMERFLPKINILKGKYWILRIGVMGRCQKEPKFDFQSQFSMSKIIRIFLISFFIEEYQFRGMIFVIDFFWNLQFLKPFT